MGVSQQTPLIFDGTTRFLPAFEEPDAVPFLKDLKTELNLFLERQDLPTFPDWVNPSYLPRYTLANLEKKLGDRDVACWLHRRVQQELRQRGVGPGPQGLQRFLKDAVEIR